MAPTSPHPLHGKGMSSCSGAASEKTAMEESMSKENVCGRAEKEKEEEEITGARHKGAMA